MSITVESASVARARRRKRTAITLLLVAAILAGTFYYASSYWNKPAGRSTATCTPTIDPSGPISPRQVTVNVYNATNRTGLAASVGKLVKDRGFILGTVGNDSSKKQIKGPAEVRFGPAGERASALVVALVTGAVAVKDTRADASVDLVLGEGYSALVTPTAPVPTTGADGC